MSEDEGEPVHADDRVCCAHCQYWQPAAARCALCGAPPPAARPPPDRLALFEAHLRDDVYAALLMQGLILLDERATLTDADGERIRKFEAGARQAARDIAQRARARAAPPPALARTGASESFRDTGTRAAGRLRAPLGARAVDLWGGGAGDALARRMYMPILVGLAAHAAEARLDAAVLADEADRLAEEAAGAALGLLGDPVA